MCECFYVFEKGDWVCCKCGDTVTPSTASHSNEAYVKRLKDNKCYCQGRITDISKAYAEAVGISTWRNPIQIIKKMKELIIKHGLAADLVDEHGGWMLEWKKATQ